jgi:two-component system, NtrC family, sensor kinase
MISQFSIPRIVLLSNDLASTHSVRKAIRRAGLTVTLEAAASREEFLSRFQYGPVDLILAASRRSDGLEISEIVKQARAGANEVPIILLGTEADDQAVLRDVTADFVRVSQFDHLPSVLERALREQRHKTIDARLQGELDRTAQILRENQKLIAIGRLTASIAHEINNPLESLTNLLYLMEVDRESPEKWEGYLRVAQRELNRVVQISKQTLTFSRETSSPLRTQLSDLIEEVVVLYGRKISDKNLRIVRQYECSEKVTVFPGEMRQVLSNLIANAIEAMEANGVLIFRMRCARNWSDQGVRGVRLSIADNGAGMPASVRRRLGEPFFTTKGQQGTGLGLWVTRSILNRYGGSLKLRSSVNPEHHGTVFSLFLPTNLRPQVVLPRGNAAPLPVPESSDSEAAASLPGDGTAYRGSRQSA